MNKKAKANTDTKQKKITAVEFTKDQYGALVRALEVAGAIYEAIAEIDPVKHDAHAAAIDELQSWVLGKAGEAGFADSVEIFEHQNVLKEAESERMTEGLDLYDEDTFLHLLAHKLADLDLERRYGADLAAMESHLRRDLHIQFEEQFGRLLAEKGLKNLRIDENQS